MQVKSSEVYDMDGQAEATEEGLHVGMVQFGIAGEEATREVHLGVGDDGVGLAYVVEGTVVVAWG